VTDEANFMAWLQATVEAGKEVTIYKTEHGHHGHIEGCPFVITVASGRWQYRSTANATLPGLLWCAINYLPCEPA